jgi:small basic protein
MFICLICLIHLQAMFNYEMDLSNYFTCLHVLELLLFIAAIITFVIYLSYMLALFGIRIFNLFKYVESMSLISLILQQQAPQPGKDRYCREAAIVVLAGGH